MRVWVTRDEDEDGPLGRALTAAGLSPVHEPVIKRHIISDAADAIGQLGTDDWLVLTSPFAVRCIAPEPARVPRVAVVGESSKREAQARRFRVELVCGEGGADALFDRLREIAQDGVICYPRSSLATPPTPWPQISLVCPVVYNTWPVKYDRTIVERVDVVSVCSASAVMAVGVVNLPYASIGPSTSTALRELSISPWVEAEYTEFASLASAIARRTRLCTVRSPA